MASAAFTLKGSDNQQSDVFTVHGKLWRVLWHNQDKPGKLFANTSALFINAFPRDDTIPQKVCSKLGTGSDSARCRAREIIISRSRPPAAVGNWPWKIFTKLRTPPW